VACWLPGRHHLLIALVLAACSSAPREGLSPDEATRLAAPRLDAFAEFDAWARRVALADPAFRSRASLEETAFSPLRGEDEVRGAWIVRRGTEARVLAMQADAREPPAPSHWVTLRGATPDGVRVARVADAVVLTRTEVGPDGAAVDVTVAYAP
jgi:hypothetical protein